MNNEDFLKRLRAAFRQEAEEHIETMASGLLDLENGSGDPGHLLEGVYRAAHSLKGAARAVGLADVETLCQALEAVFRAWRQEKTTPSQGLYDALHGGLNGVQRLVGEDDLPGAAEVRGLIEALETVAAGREPPTAAPAPPPPAAETVKPPPPPAAETVKPPPPPAAETVKPPPSPAPETVKPSPPPSPASPPKSAAPGTEGPPEREPEPAPAPAERQATVRVAADRLDDLLLQVEGTLAPKLNAEHLQQDLKRLRAEFTACRRVYESAVREAVLGLVGRDTAHAAALREGLDRHEEQLRALDRHLETLNRSALGHAKTLGRMVETLLQDTKRVAMQPFSALLTPFPRMVREIARKEGKEVRLQISGDSVEVDKRILDDLKDPMTHLLRNCIDHGIEKPERRVAAGKEAQGTVHVSVFQVDSGKVQIDVIDDGGGIRTAAVAKAAVSRGLLSQDQAETLAPEAAAALIFHSGLSSAAIVTDLSGHGLGLAIVRQKVEELGGEIHVRSIEGEGTTFSILLPMTLATFRGIVVEVENRPFVVPAFFVVRVARVAQEQVGTVEGQETVRIDRRVVPLVRLEDALELPRNSLPGVRQLFLQVVVVRAGEEQVAFAVDRVVREQEVLVKGLGPQLVRVRNISGATVLGSGEVVPILNVSDLVVTARNRSLGRRKGPGKTEEKKKRRVLVAEDSITSRMLIKNIIESAGYDVTTAVDGAEALSFLKTQSFDLLVSDVEMPRMSGLELTEKVRADARMEHLPVILVTALESREDRERGVDAGANAYIVKSSFDQGNLLETIRRFL